MQSGDRNMSSLFCLRCLLIITNLLTLVTGVAAVAIGLWLYFQDGKSDGTNEELEGDSAVLLPTANDANQWPEFEQFSFVLIGLGAYVTFVSLLGCFGAVFRSSCLLLSYLTMVVLTLTLQLMVSIFAIIYRQTVSDMLRKELLLSIQKNDIENSMSRTWDEIQSNFHCCGLDGYSDWFNSELWPDSKYVPESCCIQTLNNMTDCGKSVNPTIWYNHGCLGQIQLWVLEQVHILTLVIICLVFLQLYGIISSILLFYNNKSTTNTKKYQSYPYERAMM